MDGEVLQGCVAWRGIRRRCTWSPSVKASPYPVLVTARWVLGVCEWVLNGWFRQEGSGTGRKERSRISKGCDVGQR